MEGFVDYFSFYNANNQSNKLEKISWREYFERIIQEKFLYSVYNWCNIMLHA